MTDHIVEISTDMPAPIRLVAELFGLVARLDPDVLAEDTMIEGGPDRMVLRVTVSDRFLYGADADDD